MKYYGKGMREMKKEIVKLKCTRSDCGIDFTVGVVDEKEDQEQRKQDIIHEIESLSFQLLYEINKLKELLKDRFL